MATKSRRSLVPSISCVLVVPLLVLSACSDDPGDDTDAGTDADTDTDTDADTDTDTDSDTDADGGTFTCEVDPQRVFDDVAYLASAELAGRYPGTAGNESALVLAETLFEELGLAPAGDEGTYRQAFDFDLWELLEDPSLTVGGDALAAGDDFSVFGNSGSLSATAEIVFAGYGMTVPPFDAAEYPGCDMFTEAGYDDYAGIDVTGKIVLVVRHGPDDDMTIPDNCPDNDLCDGAACLENFSYKAENAILHGAAGMIMVQPLGYLPGISDLSGVSISPVNEPDFAALVADRDVMSAAITGLETWIEGIDDTMAPASVATGVTATVALSTGTTTVETNNVIGVLEGTDADLSDEVVLVGGHIDHLGVDGLTGDVYYGADDNASGSAVTMELARLLTHCAAPARTTVFALWNGEEEGLLGSAYYAMTDPAYPLGATVAVYSVDMVGAGDGSNLVLYGAADSANAWLAQVMAGSAAEMGYEWAVTPGEVMMSSDHAYFAAAGIPAVCSMSGALLTHPDYHTPADTIDGISVDTLEMSASLMYAGMKPLVEGTEQQYLTSGKGALPAKVERVDPRSRIFRDR